MARFQQITTGFLVLALSTFLATDATGQTPKKQPKKPGQDQKAETQYSASHIQISYAGSAWAPAKVKRSKADARALANEILDKLKRVDKLKRSEEFEKLVTAHSDDDTKDAGGFIGLFKPSKMVGKFANAVKALAPGKLSEVVETPFGFHIIRREPAIKASHIVISFKDTSLARSNAKKKITRSKEEALALAQEVLEKAQKPEADFAALARQYSDGPTGQRGGDLGTFSKGQFLPQFETASFGLKVNELSEIVETIYGFHVILRTE